MTRYPCLDRPAEDFSGGTSADIFERLASTSIMMPLSVSIGLIVGICKEYRAFPCRCPLVCGICMGGEIRLGCRGRAKSFIVQSVEILADGSRSLVRVNFYGLPLLRIARVLLLEIRRDQTGLDGEPLPAVHPLSVMLRCGPSNWPFAALAQSGCRRMTATRDKAVVRYCYL